MNQNPVPQEPKPEGEGPSEFQTAFAEAAAARSEPPVNAGDPEPPAAPEPDPEPEPQPAPPAGEGAGTEIAADDAPPAPSSDTAPTDIWAEAPDELKAAYEAAENARKAAEHRLASDNGRVAALTRQLDELRRAPAAGGQQTETPPSLKDLLESDEIKAFRTEYAEVASPILNLLTTQQAEIDRLKGTAERVEQDRTASFLDAQVAAYEAAHPDWRDYATNDQFGPWLNTQPRHIREAATRNAQHIVDAAEASDVLSRFKLHIGVAPQADPVPQPEPAPSPTPPVPDAKRHKQLAASADVRTKGPQATADVPDDFKSAFAIRAQQIEARRH